MYLIAELCGQHGGSIRRLEQMALQAKMGGANAVKVQLYDTYNMPGDNRKNWEYLNISFEDLKRFKLFCDGLHIDLFSSVFDEERLEWCIKLDFQVMKVASYVLQEWPDLAEKIVKTGKKTIVSLGMWDWENLAPPFNAQNVEYLYCVSKYPGTLEDIRMPNFNTHSFFTGYSDHSPGISATLYSITRGATIIEKHFTTSKSLQKDTEKGHLCSMDYNELIAIRTFADDFKILSSNYN